MLKLLSRITVTSIAVATVLGGAYYFTSNPDNDLTVNSNNSVVAQDTAQATLVSPKGYRDPYVWDQETEADYSGTTDMTGGNALGQRAYSTPVLTVYRSPSCGCCGVWVEHAQKHGFKIEDIKTDEMEALKQKHNIPAELASCHTTIIDGYVMEGHIPADDIKRFLAEKPDNLVGLAVPAMPIGTPGMEAKDIKQPFKVLAFNDKGEVEVFNEYQSY